MLLSIDDNPIYSRIESIILFIVSIIAVSLVIAIGLVASTQVSGYHLQNVYFPVRKNSCTCDCWDGFYRGVHSRGGYKTFYFNYERQAIVLLAILLFYGELLRHILLKLIIRKQFVLCLFIPSIYSNFYGIWSIINYINDHDYNRMLKSQSYFSLTELIASYIFYQCLTIKTKSQISPWLIYLLCTISFLHIFLAIGELNADRIGRNIGLILPDLISFVWVMIMLRQNSKLRPNAQTICKWLFVALCLWLFYHIVCPFLEKLD